MHELVQTNPSFLERYLYFVESFHDYQFLNFSPFAFVYKFTGFCFDFPAWTNNFQIHLGPVKVMRYNSAFDIVISGDEQGIIEYWSPATLQFPESEYVPMFTYTIISNVL